MKDNNNSSKKPRDYKDLIVWQRGMELDTQVLLSVELGYVTLATVEQCLSLIGELRKMLNALRRKLT